MHQNPWYRRAIERIRAEPREVRSQIAFLSALCITVVIALIWSTTLPARFGSVATIGSKISSSVQDSTALAIDAMSPRSEDTSTIATQKTPRTDANINVARDGTTTPYSNTRIADLAREINALRGSTTSIPSGNILENDIIIEVATSTAISESGTLKPFATTSSIGREVIIEVRSDAR
jgi:hypothetical protein